MRLLISGICGFAGSEIAVSLAETSHFSSIIGIDNLSRRGSWTNLEKLQRAGIEVLHGDVRNTSDLEPIDQIDWVVDAAATPSVLGGLATTSPKTSSGSAASPASAAATSSRQLLESNLLGTINLLELCKRHSAGFTLLSTSRVYAIEQLAALPLQEREQAFALDKTGELPPAVSSKGIAEAFSTRPPISLYGSTKLASELLAQEYGAAFDFPVQVNRCGVLAGGGQFGRPDQGIFAFWLHSWRERAPLRYIGFGGSGHQIRDCLHPRDLADLIATQIQSASNSTTYPVCNVSGGVASARSLAELSQWCRNRWGEHEVAADLVDRPYDLPWIVLDHSLATQQWGWQPKVSVEEILGEIADHADAHPEWLSLSR